MERIQYITQDHPELSHAQQALAMFENGIKWVQLRMKNATIEEIKAEALQIMQYAEAYDGLLILNDDVLMAKELGVKAIHIGLGDMPIDEARQLLGDDIIIGGTANTFEQVQLQVSRGADYVGVGPFRFTTTKKNLSPTVGFKGYSDIIYKMEQAGIALPMFAVGGITMNDLDNLSEIGVEHYAISGDLLKQCLRRKA